MQAMGTKKKNGKRNYLMYSNKLNQVVKWWLGGYGINTNI